MTRVVKYLPTTGSQERVAKGSLRGKTALNDGLHGRGPEIHTSAGIMGWGASGATDYRIRHNIMNSLTKVLVFGSIFQDITYYISWNNNKRIQINSINLEYISKLI